MQIFLTKIFYFCKILLWGGFMPLLMDSRLTANGEKVKIIEIGIQNLRQASLSAIRAYEECIWTATMGNS